MTVIAVLVVVMAVGIPVDWVLGSPLFIRTELVEPGVGLRRTQRPRPVRVSVARSERLRR